MKMGWWFLTLVLMLPTGAGAGQRDDLGSCYDKARIAEHRQPSSGRLLTVIVDQTIPMPQDIQRASWGQIDRFVKPGDQVRLYSFSALVPGEYLRLRFAGMLDNPIPDKLRDDVSMASLRTFDLCLKGQRKAYGSSFGKSFVQALAEANGDLPRSEIMFALKEISNDLLTQPASEHVVFLISDMLEHSSYTSFYAANSIRDLPVTQELAKVETNQLFATFNDARIYVAGAGLLTDSVKHSNRSGKSMDTLEAFWRSYFKQSGATLHGFGKPALNVELTSFAQ